MDAIRQQAIKRTSFSNPPLKRLLTRGMNCNFVRLASPLQLRIDFRGFVRRALESAPLKSGRRPQVRDCRDRSSGRLFRTAMTTRAEPSLCAAWRGLEFLLHHDFQQSLLNSCVGIAEFLPDSSVLLNSTGVKGRHCPPSRPDRQWTLNFTGKRESRNGCI